MPVFLVQQNRRTTPAEPDAAEFLRWAKISCEAWIGMSPSDRLGWARSFYYLQVLGGNAPPPYSEVAIAKLVDKTNDCGLLGACPVLTQPAMPQAIHKPQNPMGVMPVQPPPASPAPVAAPAGMVQIPKYGVPLMVAALVTAGVVAVVYSKKKKKKR